MIDRLLRSLRRPAATLAARGLLVAAVATTAIFLAWLVEHDFRIDSAWLTPFPATAASVVAVKLVIFLLLGRVHEAWRHFGLADITGLVWAATLSMLVLAGVDSAVTTAGVSLSGPHLPTAVVIGDWAWTIILMAGVRGFWWSFHEELLPAVPAVRLRPVDTTALLHRDPVALDTTAVGSLIGGRTVLVTGAGGSIGSELCRQVLAFEPARLVLIDRGENLLFLVVHDLLRQAPGAVIEPLIADITDAGRMESIMARVRPEVVFHAAAHKHVSMMERDPAEAIKNNCLGTALVARLASRHGAEAFVLISTDKAVNPTSVMGCSKLIAERCVQALASASQTRFIVVRFGNVLASNGSVVPIFLEQIRRGGPITVTHPDIARYFMTIPEAAQLVLQAAAMGRGGEVFVLDMGQRVRIVDLARSLIQLSGLGPDEIEIVYTGLTPGERLVEELYFSDERPCRTDHPKVFSAVHRPVDAVETASLFDSLAALVDEPPAVVRARLRELVPEFCSDDRTPTEASHHHG
jgi:FlaA1/EpsC-like NDP-sugar epimerase